jgi:N-acetylglutamate synthase-like GNAT family acetyltransferase
MSTAAVTLVPVETPVHRRAAEVLVGEYLRWVGGVANSEYGLSFDIEAMVRSDIEDESKFYPPSGRFYLVEHDGSFVGVGCLKCLAPGIGEVQRMFVQPHVRGVGAGRALVQRLLADAKALGYARVRLESLRALTAAHSLYHSVGFAEIEPYPENSMTEYQSPEALVTYRSSAVFMEVRLQGSAT